MSYLDIEASVWERLKSADKPILFYGMGSGADKILAEMEKRNIKCEGFFASDGFVRGQIFHGKRVMSYSEAKEKYEDFIVIISFASSIPSVIKDMLTVNREYECYAVDVPVAGENVFDREFLASHEKEFAKARELFFDEHSKELFDDLILFKLSGKLEYLFYHLSTPDEVARELTHPENFKTCADIGAYTGDTVKELMRYAPNVEKIISFEPDPKNFKRLERLARENYPDICEIYNFGAWDREEILHFNSQSNRNSGLSSTGGKGVEVRCVPLDKIIDGRMVDYIKYDVEGAEYKALLGSEKTIKAQKPKLLVSGYHRSEDLYELPMLIKKLQPEYKLYLRRFTYIPAWDINIYAL